MNVLVIVNISKHFIRKLIKIPIHNKIIMRVECIRQKESPIVDQEEFGRVITLGILIGIVNRGSVFALN